MAQYPRDLRHDFEVPFSHNTKLPPKDAALALKETSLTQTGPPCVPAGMIKREKSGKSLKYRLHGFVDSRY